MNESLTTHSSTTTKASIKTGSKTTQPSRQQDKMQKSVIPRNTLGTAKHRNHITRASKTSCVTTNTTQGSTRSQATSGTSQNRSRVKLQVDIDTPLDEATALRSQLNEALKEIEDLSQKNQLLEKQRDDAELVVDDALEELKHADYERKKLSTATEELAAALQEMEIKVQITEQELEKARIDREEFATDYVELREEVGTSLEQRDKARAELDEAKDQLKKAIKENKKLSRMLALVGNTMESEKRTASAASSEDVNDIIQRLGETILHERDQHEIQVKNLTRQIEHLRFSEMNLDSRGTEETKQVCAKQAIPQRALQGALSSTRTMTNDVEGQKSNVTKYSNTVAKSSPNDAGVRSKDPVIPIDQGISYALPPPPPKATSRTSPSQRQWVGAGVSQDIWGELNGTVKFQRNTHSTQRQQKSSETRIASYSFGGTSVEQVDLSLKRQEN